MLSTPRQREEIMEKIYFNDHQKINHPLADRVSVQNSWAHHAGENTSEIAFFLGKKFQTEIIEEFADYADGVEGGTRVYSWVPNNLIENFLQKYSANS